MLKVVGSIQMVKEKESVHCTVQILKVKESVQYRCLR